MPRVAAHVGPREDHRSAIPGLAQPRRLAGDRPTLVPTLLGHRIAGRIDQDRQHVGKRIAFERQRHQAGLRGDGDFHFVGDRQAGAAFPVFFGDEDLQVVSQPGLFLGGQIAVVQDVLVQKRQPLGRKRRGEDFVAPPFPKPGENHERAAEPTASSPLDTRAG